jgi:hypothetical protein
MVGILPREFPVVAMTKTIQAPVTYKQTKETGKNDGRS